MREMRSLMESPHPSITVLPGEEDISFWQFVIAGPDGTPYRNGNWVCVIAFPEDYPLRAPEVRFLTPILHCNVIDGITTRNVKELGDARSLLSAAMSAEISNYICNMRRA